MNSPIVSSRKTKLIHIVGRQGVGKSTLADDIITGLQKRGKTAIALVEEGLQSEPISPEEVIMLRQQPIKRPHHQPDTFDVLIAEHTEPLGPEFKLERGDLVITMVEAA